MTTSKLRKIHEAIQSEDTTYLGKLPRTYLKDRVDSFGNTLLHIAAMYGSYATIHYLVGQGSDINARDCDGDTPLHKAAINGQSKAIEKLLELGANVNSKNKFNQTANEIIIELETANRMHEQALKRMLEG